MKGFVHQKTVKVVRFVIDPCPYCQADLGNDKTRTGAKRRYARHVRSCAYNPQNRKCGSCAHGTLKVPDRRLERYNPILCTKHNNKASGLGIYAEDTCNLWEKKPDGQA